MKGWQISGNFGLDNLKLATIDELPLKPHEVRVKVHACSLNYRDLMVVKGIYNPKQPLPLVPVSDGAGEVIEIGADVKNVKVGDKVCATFSQSWEYGRVSDTAQNNTLGSPLHGMLRETVVLDEVGVINYPSFLSYEEASTLPCAALTAFNALTQEAHLVPGDSVLIEGTGGVSLFALQFAQALNLTTIVTSSSGDKMARAKKMGATHVINYREMPEWEKKVIEITGNQGVDAVVEVGGAKTFAKAIASVKRGGVIAVIGILSGISEMVDLRPILMRQIRIHGVFVGSKALFMAMNRVIEHSKIKPVIDRTFAFNDAPEAFAHLESGAHFGKVVISLM